MDVDIPVKGAGGDACSLGFPVVGVGASAGGVPALTALLGGLPRDLNAALVVVTHLPAQGKSRLAEVLAGAGPLPIVEPAANMRPQPGVVYILPAGNDIIMRDGVLTLTERAEEYPHHPINRFLSSLARDQGAASVAVILSGAGSDGVIGIRDIHGVGGLVVVQQPDTAIHESMPASAAETGLADMVLPAADIGVSLATILPNICQNTRTRFPDVDAAGEGAALESIHALLFEQTGHDMRGYKQSTVMRRLRKHMLLTGAGSLAEYAAKLAADTDERSRLFGDLLIGVTAFFRDSEAFDLLAQRAIPDIFDNLGPGEVMRTWVACCASGEEAYSVAMLLAEQQRQRGEERAVKLFATDLDAKALETARKGVYPRRLAADIGPDRLAVFCQCTADACTMTRELRDNMVFAVHNLLRDPPFLGMDLIVCRNFLIYLNSDLQARVLSLFAHALRPGGYLLLGPAETIGAAQPFFLTVDKKWRLFRRKTTAVGAFEAPPRFFSHPVPGSGALSGPAKFLQPDPEGLAETALLARYAHPAVLADLTGRVVRLVGDANAYLELGSGAPSLSVHKLVRKPLRPCLREVFEGVLADGGEHGCGPVALPDFPGVGVVLRGTALPDAWGQPAFVLLVFERVAPEKGAGLPMALPGEAQTTLVVRYEAEIERMADQLKRSVGRYETLTEELRASNEELISTNEELQSSNEEMDASREELQSLNEELTFLNAELQHKIEELAKAQSFVENLLAATNIGTVVLDAKLTVLRFTPAATELFHLIASDAGRPMEQVKTTFDSGRLVEDCQRVLAGEGIVEREICCIDDRWFLMRAYPFRSLTGEVDGVVLTFPEVTPLKKAEAVLRRGNAELEALVARRTEELREKARLLDLATVMVRDLDGRITYWNTGSERLFGWSQEEAVGRISHELLHTEFPQPLESLLAQLLRDGHWSGELRKVAKDGRIVDLAVSWVLNRDAASRPVSILEVANDVTERNRLEEQARRWSRVFESAEFGLAHVSVQDNAFIEVNAAFARQRGYDPQELVGQSLLMLIPDEERERVISSIAGFDASGHGVVETVHRRKDGSLFPVLVEVTVLRDSAGVPVSRVAYALDITERKQAEEALRDMARFPSENPNPVLRLAPDLTVIHANPASLDFLETLGSGPGRLFPECLHSIAAEALATRGNTQGEVAVGDRVYQITIHPVPQRNYINVYGLDITERKQAETALAASEARYHGLFESMGEGVCLLEMVRDAAGRPVDYRLIEINPGYTAILGVSREQAVGASVCQLYGLAAPPDLDVYERIVATGVPESFDAYFAPLQKHLRVSALRLAPDQFASIFEDVTQRVLAAEALTRSEQRLRQLVESAPDAIIIQCNGRFVSVNSAALRLFGAHTAEDLLGRDIVSLMHPDSREIVRERIRIVNERRIPQPQVEVDYLRLDGGIVPVEAISVPFEHQGQPASLVFARDITERRRAAEEKHRQSVLGDAVARIRGAYVAGYTAEAIFKTALGELLRISGSRYGFVTELLEDDRGRPLQQCLAVSATSGAATSLPADESAAPWAVTCSTVNGLNAATITSGEIGIANSPDAASVLAGQLPPGHPALDAFVGLPLMHGRECVGSIGLANREGGYDRSLLAFLGPMIEACAQIIERLRADRRLVAAKKAAEAASLSKSEFLANMSHEIRTPLNGVLGMLQLLVTTDLDEEQSEYVDNAVKSSKRLTRLLSDILDLSLVESGRLVIRQAPFAPADLRDSVMDLFALPAREKGISLAVSLGPGLPEQVVADEVRLRQILFNLVGNAVKFTDKGTVSLDISLASRRHDAAFRVLFTVADSGIGIPDDQLGAIFEPFGQVEGVYMRRFGGAGLGLSIVRRLVRLMGGEIAVESVEGRGTAMYVSLPLAQAANGQSAVCPAQTPGLASAAGLRLLLAEDDAVSLMSFARMLQKAGHTVDMVDNGAKVIDRLREAAYDCILMDVQMPVMDGVAATKAIRADASLGPRARVPIIAMTAYAMAGDREKFLAAGMDDYVSKPVDVRELALALGRVLSRPSPPQQAADQT
ncbi:PAS domain S-box protein [Desulfovibrio sp. TomC]|uniref:PAS domain S-box protein n=1 Tax=Desulfovibrio sp. TomC TaxID=1562888 RepID=UPI000574AEFA|nr:PAS domain S-box protein [Desulfovibrio sp. TomC]KHK00613.1 Chemotaxis protein methyltransferase CheR [Desulfovibrio sp. TomC]